MKDMKYIGFITLWYGTGDTEHGAIFIDDESVYVVYLHRPTGLEKTTAYETGTIRSYNCLTAMIWDQISGRETEITIVPKEEYAEYWLSFACDEWFNARHDMTEAERNCFIGLMSSCLETMQ